MENPNFRIGMTAIEVVVELVRVQSEITHLSFDIYTPSRNIREMQQAPGIDHLLRHCPSKPCFLWRRDYITTERLSNTRLKENEVLALRSDVLIESSGSFNVFHIPMMDFADWQSLHEIEDFFRAINRANGVILSSGRSYHYYGLGLLDEWQWQNFLGDCLLSELADKRYVGHQFKDRCCVLRLSACPLRPEIPTVVSIL